MGEIEGKTEEELMQKDVDDMLGDMVGGSSSEEEEEGGQGDEELQEEEDAEGGEGEEEEGAPDEDEAAGEEADEAEGGGEEEEEEPGAGDGDEGDDAEVEEDEDKDALIARLRKEIAKKGEKDEKEEEVSEEEEGEVEEFSVLGDMSAADLDSMLDDPKQFNTVLGSALDRYGVRLTKRILTSLPEIVMRQIRQQTTIKAAVDDFYNDHKELVPYKKLVGITVNETVKNHPDWKMDKIFEESAKTARETLGLKKKAKKGKEAGRKKPSFAGPSGRSKGKGEVVKKSKLQKDIDAMLSL